MCGRGVFDAAMPAPKAGCMMKKGAQGEHMLFRGMSNVLSEDRS